MGRLGGGLSFLVVCALVFFVGLMWWRIVKKTGFHSALGLLMFVLIANIVMLAVLAFGGLADP